MTTSQPVVTVTLADFLLARIAEDERDAAGALGRHWDSREYRKVRVSLYDEPRGIAVASWPTQREHWEEVYAGGVGTTFTHIARWDPARVLAECEAKRQIVADFVPLLAETDGVIYSEWGNYDDLEGKMLRLLALPYADHPDFRPEWKA